MKRIRFVHEGSERLGTLDANGRITPCQGDFFGELRPAGETVSADAVRLVTPTQPSKLIALWNNSRPVIGKSGRQTPAEPLYFIKPASCYAATGDDIVYPQGQSQDVVLEGELGVVIGKRSRDVPADRARDVILGYTCINDITARDLVGRDQTFAQYTRAKGFDSFGIFGPCVADDVDPAALRVQARINGNVVQDYAVTDLVFGPCDLVAHLSRCMTLEPGDVIACGTSTGVTPIKPGDVVEISIAGIGSLVNRVRG